MNRISTHKKSKKGTQTPEFDVTGLRGGVKKCGGVTVGTTTEGHGMYVFVYGNGSKRKSETRHCSEGQAKAYKEQLEKAGW